MTTRRKALQALRTLVNAQLATTGDDPVSLNKLLKAINQGPGGLVAPDWTSAGSNRWSRTTPDGQRNYVAKIAGPRWAELHCWPGAAHLHLYTGTPDPDADDPLGFTEGSAAVIYGEDVDPAAVADDTTATAWLTARIAAGLPTAAAS